MTHDENFARRLRAQAATVAPRIDVGTERVVPRARRRRAAVRGLSTVALTAVVAGGGWMGAQAWTDPPVDNPPAVDGRDNDRERPPSPIAVSEEKAAAFYDELVAAGECLARLGYAVPAPPSRPASIDSMLHGDGIIDPLWDPYEPLFLGEVSRAEMDEAMAECPAPRWGVD